MSCLGEEAVPRKRDSEEQPRKSVEQVLGELRPVWDAWAAKLRETCDWGDDDVPTGWQVGAAYLRESHKDSMAGHSPPAQFKGILDDALRNKVWIPWEYVFLDNVTGRTGNRPAFLGLMDVARSNKIQSVCVFHSSRFARNVGLARKYKDELRRRGIEVRALNIQIDTATPEGRLMETVQEAFDEYQSDSTGKWISVSLRDKHEAGQPIGNLPETFFRDSAGVIRPHPELSAIVLEGAGKYLSDPGHRGMGWLAAWSDEQGHRTPAGRRLSKEWWRNTLRNPMCAGYVGYHRKRGGKELQRGAFEGFMSLALFEQLQEKRATRTRAPGERKSYATYVMSGSSCVCGGRVVAGGKQRLRCRKATEHAGCNQKSVLPADLEGQMREWLPKAVTLPNELKPRLVSLVRAKLGRGSDAAKAGRIRQAMGKLTQAYTWGGIEESDYREQLRTLKSQLAFAEQQPEETRMLGAIKLAQDLPTLWDAATPARRKDLFWSLFEKATVADGRIVSVRPHPAIAPLVALQVHMCGPDRIRTGDLVLDRDVC